MLRSFYVDDGAHGLLERALDTRSSALLRNQRFKFVIGQRSKLSAAATCPLQSRAVVEPLNVAEPERDAGREARAFSAIRVHRDRSADDRARIQQALIHQRKRVLA